MRHSEKVLQVPEDELFETIDAIVEGRHVYV
jgi:hypothetical protein